MGYRRQKLLIIKSGEGGGAITEDAFALVAGAALNTGVGKTTDTLDLVALNDTTLRIMPAQEMFFVENFATGIPITEAMVSFPQLDYPLANLGLVADGTYLRYIGYDVDGVVQVGSANFFMNQSVAHLGFVLVKRVGGVTTFLDGVAGPRNVSSSPMMASSSLLERAYATTQSNVHVVPIAGGMTVSKSAGVMRAPSVNWHGGANIHELLIASQTPASFTRINPLSAAAAVLPVATTAFKCDTYWNGVASVAVPGPNNATVQRWLVGFKGGLWLQEGEVVYTNLADAVDAISNAPFSSIYPVDTYAEVARTAAVKSTTDINNNAQAVTIQTGNVGGSGSGAAGSGPVFAEALLGVTIAPNVINASLQNITPVTGLLSIAGNVGVGGAPAIANTHLRLPASVSGVSPLRIPHGVSPAAPVDGDIWTTPAGVFAQISGTTVQLNPSVGSGVDASTLTGTTLASNVVNASLNNIVPAGGVFKVTGGVNFQTGIPPGILIGADNTATTLTNAVIKAGRMALVHYLNAEEPMCIFNSSSDLADNKLHIGGGSGVFNTATEVNIYAAANTTTLGNQPVAQFKAASTTLNTDILLGNPAGTRFATTVPTQFVIYGGTEGGARFIAMGNSHATLPGQAFIDGVTLITERVNGIAIGVWAPTGLTVTGVTTATAFRATGQVLDTSVVASKTYLDFVGAYGRVMVSGPNPATVGRFKIGLIASDGFLYNEVADFQSTGLTIVGTITSTGNLTANNFSGSHSGTSTGTNTGDQNLSGYALLSGAAFTGPVSSTAGFLSTVASAGFTATTGGITTVLSSNGGSFVGSTTNHSFNLLSNNIVVASMSPGVFGVTGNLAATGRISAGQVGGIAFIGGTAGTSSTQALLILDSGSGAGGGAMVGLRANGVDVGYMGMSSVILGGAVADLMLRSINGSLLLQANNQHVVTIAGGSATVFGSLIIKTPDATNSFFVQGVTGMYLVAPYVSATVGQSIVSCNLAGSVLQPLSQSASIHRLLADNTLVFSAAVVGVSVNTTMTVNTNSGQQVVADFTSANTDPYIRVTNPGGVQGFLQAVATGRVGLGSITNHFVDIRVANVARMTLSTINITTTVPLSVGGRIEFDGGGGLNAVIAVNQRNPIFRFVSAQDYGVSWFQGTASTDGVNSVGIHFATTLAAASLFEVTQAGVIYMRASVVGLTNLAQNGGYHNFDATIGDPGFGFRSSGGTMQFKHYGGSWTTIPSTSGGGGVSSIDIAGQNGITVTGSPILSAGTITLSLSAITVNSVSIGGNQIIGARSAACPNLTLQVSNFNSDQSLHSTNYGQIMNQFNLLLGYLRTHGLISP